jgi:hypothetical protein
LRIRSGSRRSGPLTGRQPDDGLLQAAGQCRDIGRRPHFEEPHRNGLPYCWSTGHIANKAKYAFGFFEITRKIAGIPGENNAFWLTTDDNFEIDIGEASYPGNIDIGLQYWPPNKTKKHAGVGWSATFRENLSQGFHDLGLFWLFSSNLTFCDLVIYVNVSLRSGSHAMFAVRRLRSPTSPEVGAALFPAALADQGWVASAADR